MSCTIKGDIIGLSDSTVIEDLQIVDHTLLNTVSKTDINDDQTFALAKENLLNDVIETASKDDIVVIANVLEFNLNDDQKIALVKENLLNAVIETASKDDIAVMANVLEFNLNDDHKISLEKENLLSEVIDAADLVTDDKTFALAKRNLLDDGHLSVLDTTPPGDLVGTKREVAAISICTTEATSAHRRSQRTRKFAPSKYPR